MLPIHSQIKSRLATFRENGQIPNLLFYGPVGSGKTTLIRDFIADIYRHDRVLQGQCVKHVNCSVNLSNDAQFIREEIKFFAQQQIADIQAPFKIVVLENASDLSIETQSALRRCIEIYMAKTRFFIDTTTKNGIIKPILSRFCEIYVDTPIDLRTHKPINLHKQYMATEIRNQVSRLVNNRLHNLRQRLQKYLGEDKSYNVCDVAEELYDAGISASDVLSILETDVTNKYQNLVFSFYTLQTHIHDERLLMATLFRCVQTDTINILSD